MEAKVVSRLDLVTERMEVDPKVGSTVDMNFKINQGIVVEILFQLD